MEKESKCNGESLLCSYSIETTITLKTARKF